MLKSNKPYLLASILSADLLNIHQECTELVENGIDGFHVDIMDGHFVPNISFGPSIVSQLHASFPNVLIDCHLMVSDPKFWIRSLLKSQIISISFHVEAVENISECKDLIARVKDRGISCGIAINPKTSVESVLDLIENVDYVLVMTVEPGFGGQSLMMNCLEKVKMLKTAYPKLSVQVDGGVNEANIAKVIESGADVVVSGSAITSSANQRKTIEFMKSFFSQ